MGKANRTGWLLRRFPRGPAHRDPRGPTPLGPAGTPLVPALTHSTSGAVTGSNARLGTSKDLSAGHGTPLRRFGGDDNTYRDPAGKRRDYHRGTHAPTSRGITVGRGVHK